MALKFGCIRVSWGNLKKKNLSLLTASQTNYSITSSLGNLAAVFFKASLMVWWEPRWKAPGPGTNWVMAAKVLHPCGASQSL